MLNTGIGDDHLHFTATDFAPSFQDKGGIRFDQILPRLTFSGPLRKGKAWFYDALDGEYDNIVYTELPSDADNDHLLRLGNLAKVQANVTSRNIVTTSFLVNHLRDSYAGLSPQSPELANPLHFESGYVASMKDQYYFRGGELLDAGAAFTEYTLRTLPMELSLLHYPRDSGRKLLPRRSDACPPLAGASELFLPPRHWYGGTS